MPATSTSSPSPIRGSAAPRPERHRFRSWPLVALLLLVLPALAPTSPKGGVAAQDAARFQPEEGYRLPPEAVRDIFSRDPNFATLDAPDPTGNTFLVPLSTELSTLERMAETTYRLAEVELRPRTDRLWHLDTYGVYGFRLFSLPDRAFRDVALPEGAFASDFMWTDDGARLAFLAHLRDGTEVWTVEPATGRAGPVSDTRILATIATRAQGQGSRPSDMLQWTPEGSLLTLAVPPARGAEPERPAVPSSPGIRRTLDGAAQTRTFPNLLNDAHDADLFEHYTTSVLVELREGAEPRFIGEPAMYQSIRLSPDGRHVIATMVERPFSYIVSWSGFPRRTVILDRQDGSVLATLEERPLREGGGGGPPGGGNDDESRRAFQWRPDGAGLAYVERRDRSGENLMLLTAPFDFDDAVVVTELEERVGNVTYDLEGRHAIATVTRSGRSGLLHIDLTAEEPQARVLLEPAAQDDPTELRGSLVTTRTANGLTYARVSSGDDAVFLEGPGFRADFRPRPFVDRLDLASGELERVFEGSSDTFDRPLVPLDADFRRLIVSRESSTQFPDSYLREADGSFVNLTNNVDPFPEVTAARRIDFSFTRRDGLEVQARISLPTDYVEGTRVPAVFWTYPREYTQPESYERAAIRARNHNAFHHMTWLRWSDIWLTQGYAVVYPDVPIVGENYNDTYIANLVDAMYAAIRAVDGLGYVDIERIGHGGHSYGAFTTANLLAHTPYFRAGIAGHGAYNRTLTPSGFQSERRTLWEAPHTYAAISPFFHAHQIETPLLMYHGTDDNNTGTWPVQSERLIHALTTLGKDAVLYLYPFESHTPRAIENNLDMWARWLEWFDHYVKDGGAPAVTAVDAAGEEGAEGG